MDDTQCQAEESNGNVLSEEYSIVSNSKNEDTDNTEDDEDDDSEPNLDDDYSHSFFYENHFVSQNKKSLTHTFEHICRDGFDSNILKSLDAFQINQMF